MRSGGNKQRNMVMQILLAPRKVLRKAADFYTKTMTNFAEKLGCYSSGPPVGNFNMASRESITIADCRTFLSRNRKEISVVNLHGKGGTIGYFSVGRNSYYSVGIGKIGRIDEERPCSFREIDIVEADVYPRSRSHAVRRKIVRVPQSQ